MTPVYMSPNLEQIKLIEEALRSRGINTSKIAKRQAGDSSVQFLPTTMHELWLKRQSDQLSAKSIISQEEIRILRQDMNTVPTRRFNETQPVSKDALNPGKFEFTVTDRGRQRLKKDYWVPKNLINVFKRLGTLLGVSEPEMELSKFYKIQKPWDADSLMDSVEKLKKKCNPGAGSDSDIIKRPQD